MSDATYSYKPAGSTAPAEHINQKTYDQLKAAKLLTGAEVARLPAAPEKPAAIVPAATTAARAAAAATTEAKK